MPCYPVIELTAEQEDILSLVYLENSQIGELLGIKEKSIQARFHTLREKLGWVDDRTKTRVTMLRFALENNIHIDERHLQNPRYNPNQDELSPRMRTYRNVAARQGRTIRKQKRRKRRA
jgi:hypothetical protein